MSKLDQRIAEINAKILELACKKSRLLAIKFGAKGGEGSGRYPAGSGEAQNTVGAKYTREAVGSLKTASWARQQIDTSKGDAKVKSELKDLRITATGQVFETFKDGGDNKEATQSDVVNTIQSVLGMHPADLRDVIFADNQIPENDIIGTPQIDFKVEKFSDEGRITVGASVMTKQVEVKIKIEEDKTGYKTLKSNAYVPLADGQDHTPNNLAMMNRVSRNIVALGQAMGIAKNNIVQTKVPTKKAKF